MKSLYFKGRTTNSAAAGVVRLAKTDLVSWRNNANSADLSLSVDASDNLLFNGVQIVSSFTPNDTDSIDLDLTASVLTASLNLSAASADAGFFNAVNSIETDGLQTQVKIADTSHTGVISSTDWNTFNGKQASGNYITALTGDVVASGPGSAAATIQAGVIVNSMISASAAISFSKLATLADGNILVGSGPGVATSVAMSGEASIINTGAVTLSNAAVIAKVLTGYSSGAGTVASTDTILQAIQKLNGNDALNILKSTLTAKGNILTATASATPAVLAVGTDGYVLNSDSSQSTGLGWRIVDGAVVSKTADYTATVADGTILYDVSGASRALTLYAASIVSAPILTVRKTDSSFNTVTITGTGLSTTLNTQGESITIRPDGTNWQILSRYIPSTVTVYTPTMTGFGSVTNGNSYWQRRGNMLYGSFRVTVGTPGSNCRVGLPGSLTCDNTYNARPVGAFGRDVAAVVWYFLNPSPGNSYVFGAYSGGGAFSETNGSTILNAGENVGGNFEVAITGWNS